jgi:hypothetical protein
VRAVFASGLLLHLATTAIAAVLLARLGHSPLWAALLLFHPTLAIYSRTVLGDEAAGTGLLLAALALTSTRPSAGVLAGLAVGGAALMRYHAGLVLPIVAATFLFLPNRTHPKRDALLCLLAGGALGALLVSYNLWLYGNPVEAHSNSHGSFGLQYFEAQAPYYVCALMAFWPAMLLAPLFDRSRLRWMIRGVCGFFFVFLSFYYFHDKTNRWIETLIVGQRLLQVALPLWITSYACVVDDWVAGPLRRWLGRRGWAGLVALVCAGLLAATGLIFRKHQDHLNRLCVIRDVAAATIPPGSKVIYDGPFLTIFGIPSGLPPYRWRPLLFQYAVMDKMWQIDEERQPWYLALAPKWPGEPMHAAARALVDEYQMEPLVSRADVSIYVGRPGKAGGIDDTGGLTRAGQSLGLRPGQ